MRNLFLVILLGLSLMFGCGKSKPSESEFMDMTGQNAVTELRDMLKSLSAEKKAMPKSAQDLSALEPVFPLSAGQLSSGAMVYAWGTGITEGNSEATIIAHPNDAETVGGWVLFKDGSIKKVSVEEFGAAKKSTKPPKKK